MMSLYCCVIVTVVHKQVNEEWQDLSVSVTKSDIPSDRLEPLKEAATILSENFVVTGHGISHLLVTEKWGKVQEFHVYK